MFVVIWEYEVRAGGDAAFETLYGAEGAWVELFRAYAGYVGTELLRGTGRHYLSIDRWTSAAAYEAFLVAAQPRYAAIDEQGDAVTLSERRVGAYTTP